MVQHNSQWAAYLEDTYLMELATEVTAAGRHDDGVAWVAVRRNIFHPQGGGQPADRGWVGEREAAPVRDPATGLVVVRGGFDDLAVGDAVHTRIDADLRLLHAALHTAGHLVEAAGRVEGWTMAGSVHFPGQARIEFTPQDALDDRDKAAARLAEYVEAAVADDLPVTADYDGEGRRIVRLGDAHAAPCGGTHVRSLAELAHVTIASVKTKKGRIRVSYDAAHRPRP
ncbi:hypothetical protein [Nonomuraea sp. CA-141351]|uniref:hypothetical protein n=1 Tax=Nonomuraea sp. CA-141351 TaxID=3239996 RepID=UPI003D8AAEE4